jgi:hypothetical protein
MLHDRCRPWRRTAPLPCPTDNERSAVKGFLATLAEQRWDDHRYYHHSRINQSLHFVSAISFLVAYALLFVDPAWAAIVGWCVSMGTRQSGHFFFEPRGFDRINNVSDDYKEEIKVGYNMQRKTVLIAVWALIPLLLWWQPSLFGLIAPAASLSETVHDTGIAWLALAAAGLALRVLQLELTRGRFTGIVWLAKILTDPFHDIALYWRAPLALLRGELLDPMEHIRRTR